MTENTIAEPPVHATVLTLTLNPALDETIALEELRPGAVHRAAMSRQEPGGKGINVAAMLAAGGIQTAATGILGSDNADFFSSFFAARGIENRFLSAKGATRQNIKLVSPAETTDINLPGLKAAPAQLAELRHLLAAAESEFLVLSGSLPPDCPDSFYADFLQFYRDYQPAENRKKAKCVADCSGRPLKALLSGAARPFCIKPNRDELAEWAEKPLRGQAEILAQAQALQRTGIALVVVSQGGDGALFVAENAAYHAKIALERVASTVGAGDAMVAGIIAAALRQEIGDNAVNDGDLAVIAAQATLWAAGKLECAGAALPPPARLAELEQKLCCEKLY